MHSVTYETNEPLSLEAVRIVLAGCVQGAGVRPAIARLAMSLELTGFLRNSLCGLTIEVEGRPVPMAMFRQQLRSSLPIGVELEKVEIVPIDPREYASFAIQSDETLGPLTTQVPRDRVVCDECLADVANRENQRHLYPLTTCASCGPRFSLIQKMPFERHHTTLDVFTLCDECRTEYASPADRRFHAQTIGCPKCGPQVWLADAKRLRLAVGRDVASAAARCLLEGKIVALRGVGGYQLLCDATSDVAVNRLRRRKARPAKPFAVLVATLDEARRHAVIDETECETLQDRSNPIVLLRAKCGAIADAVNPGLNKVGLMLPTTPLHALLCAEVGKPLVCTSANREGEPLEYEVQSTERNLVDIADVWLHHNRPIARPIDDSVVQVIAGRRVTVRLARGLAPLPLSLPNAKPQLAAGGHMKSAIAWHNGSQAALGPHIGDLDSVATRERFTEHVADMRSLYGFEPEAAIIDLHPDYFTTRFASERAVPTLGVQHHVAHVAAGMLEHGLLDRQVLGVSWDGTGFGDDGTIWGGEFLVVGRAAEYERVAHLRPFRSPGGEVAVRQPWRIAVSLLSESLADDAWIDHAYAIWSQQPITMVLQLTRRSSDRLRSTSAGRLFDAVAAIILGIDLVHYEGQAAMMLEAVASCDSHDRYPLPLVEGQLDWRPMVRSVWHDRFSDVDPAIISARFHRALASGIVAVASQFRDLPIVLGGGVFQNKLLTEMVAEMLDDRERLKLPGAIPPNDGGLAAGQLAVSIMREQAAFQNESRRGR